MSSAQLLVHAFLLILFAQTLPQSPTASKVERIQMKQEDLCCWDMKFVKPTYPREARLAHTEGVAKLEILISDDNSIAEIRPVSGDPLLLDSSITAVRQWRIYSSLAKVVGKPVEIEIPVSFMFTIEDVPRPAYLHLVNGKVIRADDVREFTNEIEYTIGQHTHHISADSVADVNGCARIVLRPPQRQGECLPSGEPSFDIRAIPLLPSETAPKAQARQQQRIQVTENVQEAKLVQRVSPIYPPLLNGMPTNGTVVLHVIIGKNGSVKSARPVSGPPYFRDSAVKAVLQWRYEATLMSGVAVEVDTTVPVVFELPMKQEAPAAKK